MSQHGLTQDEIRFLQEALGQDYKTASVRLREGEYQYSLAKAIASFQLELYFPDVKDMTKKIYGEEKTHDIQFVRRIQTILKKMERGNVVRIFPKKKPWELQRYGLPSFKFQDVDKNLVALATEQQMEQMENRLHSLLSQQEASKSAGPSNTTIKIGVLALMVAASYTAILWTLTQPLINPIISVLSFSIAVTCSLILGKTLSQE